MASALICLAAFSAGMGELIDDGPRVYSRDKMLDINGSPINPAARLYPVGVYNRPASRQLTGLTRWYEVKKLPILGLGRPMHPACRADRPPGPKVLSDSTLCGRVPRRWESLLRKPTPYTRFSAYGRNRPNGAVSSTLGPTAAIERITYSAHGADSRGVSGVRAQHAMYLL